MLFSCLTPVGQLLFIIMVVALLNGADRCHLLNTENEDGSDLNFSFRIFQYSYRILYGYQVPVETIAIFTGNEKQVHPGKYIYDGIKTLHHFNYLFYHIFEHKESELLAMDNIFAYIVLACQKALQEGKVLEEGLATDRNTIARALIDREKYDKDRIISFFNFLEKLHKCSLYEKKYFEVLSVHSRIKACRETLIFISDKRMNSIFNTYIYKVTRVTIDMGVREIVKRAGVKEQ